MSDPIQALADEVRSLKRQVRALATSARATRTSVQHGSTRWLDGDGEERVTIATSDDTGAPVLRALNNDGSARVMLIESGEMKAPVGTASWMRDMNRAIDANGRPLTSSTNFETLWSATVFVSAKRVTFSVTLGLGASVTSAEARLTALTLGLYTGDSELYIPDGGVTQTMREWTGVTSTEALDVGFIPFPDDLRDPPASAVGSAVHLELLARRSGGSGSVWLAPSPLILS